jgi:lipopolysaccharide assembly outer membrane protein LptD (OstA)
VELRGNVHVFYSNGTEIVADSLKWDQPNDRVNTEGFVKITKRDGSVLTGIGLTTDPRFTSYRLKNPVGEVQVSKEVPQ